MTKNKEGTDYYIARIENLEKIISILRDNLKEERHIWQDKVRQLEEEVARLEQQLNLQVE